jgi:hypothetical protein
MLGLTLASFYLLPVLFELQFTQQHLFPLITFEPLWKFFYTPWKYGLLFQGPNGELSFLVGYIQWLLIAISVILLWGKKVKKEIKPLLIFSLVSFLILFFFIQGVSQSFWYSIPLMRNLQFSYRLMSEIIFFSSIIAAIVSSYLPKKVVYGIIVFAVFSTILNWGNRQNLPDTTDMQLRQNLPYSTFQGEGLVPAAPIWVNSKTPWFENPPQQHIEVVKGKGKVIQISRKTNEHIYKVNALTPVLLQENTLFFPGWKVLVNEKAIPIAISQKQNKEGLIVASIPKGTYTLRVVYEQTFLRKLGVGLSLLGIVTWFTVILIGYKKYSI